MKLIPLANVLREAKKLSIPYWDFLVLKHKRILYNEFDSFLTFNSLLGFSSFETYGVPPGAKQAVRTTFNSLLGFSSFETGANKAMAHTTIQTFQFPIGIF